MGYGAASEHDADHGELHECNSDASVAFVVPRETPVAADPSQSAFHDPAFRQHDEASNIAALHDLERPVTGAGDESTHLRPGVATVGNDTLDERETPPSLPQQRFGAVTVLDISGMDVYVQQQALRVDEDVALTAENLFPGIVSRWVERAPPFTAPFALCASRIAVVGLASRPERSRLST